MRFELLLFLSLACLAFTAQTAPASAKDALQEHKRKQRDSEPHKHKPKSGPHLHRHPKQHHDDHHHKSSHPDHGNNLKHTRALASEGLKVAEETKTILVPENESKLHAKIGRMEKTHLEKEKKKQHEIERADIIEIAKHGAVPPKFPLVTRISSFIGITAAVANVANFIFSAKTTALATEQFSAPPTPPTFIDTAGRWDGQQYQLMPLPQEPDDTKSARKKRSLPDESATVPPAHKRMVKRKRPHHTEQSQKLDEAQDDPKLSKRSATAAGVGFLLGGAIAPGIPSLVMGWEPEVDKTPFNPYDPNVLKPNDPFAVAAADPDHALPALPMQNPAPSGSSNALPSLRNIVFPASAYSSSATSFLQQPQQQLTAATAQQGRDIRRGSSPPSASDEVQTVLRKRSVEAKHSTKVEHQESESSTPLEKRFLFSKGPWGKVSGGVALGSIAYVLYEGVSHARWRQENPRDREILKDLDDTPMYGAVGVPKRIPGQLATKAMPGYSDYVAKLAAQQQAQQQAAMQRQKWQHLATAQAEARDALTAQAIAAQSSSGGVGVAAADAGSNDPVLRRRSSDASSAVSAKPVFGNAGQNRLDKRGNKLLVGGLAFIGLGLGYLQSATMFPSDRDEEKDKEKRERKKQEEQQLLMQQQQAIALAPAAQSAGMGYAPSGAAPDASAPPVSSSDGGGFAFPSSAYGSSGSTSPPFMGAGSFSPSAGTGSSTGGASSVSAALNAAAGYSSTGGSASGSVLKKRDISGHPDQKSETRSLSKRSPGIGSFISIAGTTMFLGTLAGNLVVGERQKHKPVPYVTPNADTRGPMVPGGELYTKYLQSKRPPSTSGDAFGDVGAGLTMGTPASINGQNMGPASAPASIYGQTPVVGSQLGANTGTAASPDAPDVGRGGGADPVLKKRHSPRLEKRTLPGLEAAAVEAETAARMLTKVIPTVEAEVGAASALSRSAALSEAGAASRFAPVTRFSSLSGVRGGAAASEAGFAGLGRASMADEGSTAARIYQPNAAAVGSARPAMLSDLGGASGRAGTPATFARSTSTRQLSPAEMQGLQQKVAAGRAADMNPGVKGMPGQAPEEAKKEWTLQKVAGIVGTASGATILFNGAS